MADTLSSVLNWLIPTLLLLIALGWLYIKFLGPYVMPMLKNFFGWLSGRASEVPSLIHGKKEITYD